MATTYPFVSKLIRGDVEDIMCTDTNQAAALREIELQRDKAVRAELLQLVAQALPANIIRDCIYPFAFPVFTKKRQLQKAVMKYMRYLRRGFPDGYCPISQWDVSRLTDFSHLFDGQMSFKGDLSQWDVSQGTNFSHMFRGCQFFNSDLSRWDISKATDVSCMFSRCHSFNSDLSSWDLSNVTNVNGMLDRCYSLQAEWSGWDVSIRCECPALTFDIGEEADEDLHEDTVNEDTDEDESEGIIDPWMPDEAAGEDDLRVDLPDDLETWA